jgi:hypothetical protein
MNFIFRKATGEGNDVKGKGKFVLVLNEVPCHEEVSYA